MDTMTRLAVVVDDTTCALMLVRRPTDAEMSGIRKEYRTDMLLAVGESEDLPRIGRREVWAAIPGEPDGWLPGSNNAAYYVTTEQADALRAISLKYVAVSAARIAREDAIYADEDARANKPCPKCGSYCYGDCEAN